ncbi:YqhV family protein [Desulfotruncus alcoholivorax]|uniref:YqhV family protein n=1 Tax=Desulfotruncus alcoholivorax TaxID=265477 RepID=UPI0004054A8D|nr:YqhV family protein [Desulfotruncus alcoholivorax]
MFYVFDKIVLSMAAVRFLSATIEFSAAMLMLYFNRVEHAFKINAMLALVGPTVMITVTTLGLVGLAGKVSLSGMVLILAGVALIFLGVRQI